MRCYCCNKNLSDYESTLRSATTGEFLDMCNNCIKESGVSAGRSTKDPDEEAPSEENYWDFDEVEFNPNVEFDDEL